MTDDQPARRRRLTRSRRNGPTFEDEGPAAAPVEPQAGAEPEVRPTPIRRSGGPVRRSGGGARRRDRRQVESGGFGDGAKEGESYPIDARSGPGHTGPGRSGAPPTKEIDAAQQRLMLTLGHQFSTLEPLAAALTHPSWRNERPDVTLDNQRIEFLGDLVLGMAVGEILLLRLPRSDEGELSVLKAKLVRKSTLAHVAGKLGVGPALRLGRGEERSGGRTRPAVLADAMEAVFAAVFIDAGYDRARNVIERALSDSLEELLAATGELGSETTMDLHARTENYKTALQEWLAAAGEDAPQYTLLEQSGAPGERMFHVQVEAHVAGEVRRGLGEDRTVKGAENLAAEQLYAALSAPS